MRSGYSLILFSNAHKVGLVRDITSDLDIDNIYILNPLEQGKGLSALLIKIFFSRVQKEVFVFLDFRPLIVQVLLSIINRNGHYSVFIQHGYFETSGHRNLGRRSVTWYINSMYFVSLFILFGVKGGIHMPGRLAMSVEMLRKGAARMLREISSSLKWNMVFIYDRGSKDIFVREFKGEVDEINISGTLDLEAFRFDAQGEMIYVSQPLHYTGHVSQEGYKDYLINLFNENQDLYFMLHPKIPFDWVANIVKESKIIRKQDLVYRISARKVVGHFSSILLGIDKRIELQIVDMIGAERLDECQKFSPYQNIEFNGLVRIKEVLSTHFK